MKILKGQCMCRSVTYEVEDDFQYALNCHCSECRRATGAAFKPLAGIKIGKLSIIEGKAATMTYGDDEAHDVHCKNCGSLLYSVVREGQYAHVTMGTLVDSPSIRPSEHIFVSSKAPWFEITDDLPQHKEYG